MQVCKICNTISNEKYSLNKLYWNFIPRSEVVNVFDYESNFNKCQFCTEKLNNSVYFINNPNHIVFYLSTELYTFTFYSDYIIEIRAGTKFYDRLERKFYLYDANVYSNITNFLNDFLESQLFQ